jgi:tetratricopeptide (TPR) repeat protein
LATVLCGLLAARGAGPADLRARAAAGGDDPGRPRSARLEPAFGALLVIGLGLWMMSERWKTTRAESWRQMAVQDDQASDAGRPDRKIKHIEMAVRLSPDDARLQSEAAYAHFRAYQEMETEWAERQPGVAPGKEAVARLKRARMVPCLRHMLRARDLCPVRAIAHLDLAALVHDLRQADPQDAYLDRAVLLAPAEPRVWYAAGRLALADGRLPSAWAYWRRALALSRDLLPQVLEQSRRHLDTAGLLRDVLPDQPELLLAVAARLPAGSDGDRRLILERALAILVRGSKPLTALEVHTRGTIRQALGDPPGALKDYQAALLLEPRRSAWRYDRARLLVEQGRFEEAHQEVLTILALEPKNVPARELLDTVARGLAEQP